MCRCARCARRARGRPPAQSAVRMADSAAVDGIHDLGGMEGFGPVEVEPDEHPFHERWEGRVHGMMLALATKRGITGLRDCIESMGIARSPSTQIYVHMIHELD